MIALDQYVAGSWNVICDRCGKQYKSHQIRKEWTGLRVCSGPGTHSCWEPRHPQDFVTGIPDRQSPPWVRPRNTQDVTLSNPVDDTGGIPGILYEFSMIYDDGSPMIYDDGSQIAYGD